MVAQASNGQLCPFSSPNEWQVSGGEGGTLSGDQGVGCRTAAFAPAPPTTGVSKIGPHLADVVYLIIGVKAG